MRNTKIDWADDSWNPVTGCLHGCPYCYARGIAQRFGCKIMGDLKESTEKMIVLDEPYVSREGVKNPYPYEFLPTFHRYRLDIPKTLKKPRNIFVCSMADLFGEWVPDEVIQEVMDACRAARWHRYLFLTKNPKRYEDIIRKDILSGREGYIWLGSTTTTHQDPAFFTMNVREEFNRVKTFVSIEPILEQFGKCNPYGSVAMTDWVIIGAETGNRKSKVVPEKEWIMEIAGECDRYNTPLFMKESLRGIMGDDFIQEFPWR